MSQGQYVVGLGGHALVLAITGAVLLAGCSGEEGTTAVEQTEVASSALSSDSTVASAEKPKLEIDPAFSMDSSSTHHRYIVVLKPGTAKKAVMGQRVPDIAKAMKQKHGGKLVRVYEHALDGLVMDIPPESLDAVKADERVAYIEPDGIATGDGSQSGATWGIDRIDQRQMPLNQTYNYPNGRGQGVHAYILDSGIYAAHPEFGGRVVPEYDFIDNDSNPDDCFGHGTHVAGTVGSSSYGVAKGVTLHSVRVLDCGNSASWSVILSGIDYVTGHHIKPAVVNMSLGGGFIQSINDAVTRSIAAGVTYVIAAGNNNGDACDISPASTPAAITVGATENGDRRGTSPDSGDFFSNYGTCLDLFAPGKDVLSSYLKGTTKVWWGTSMATPHVTGAAALYLALNPSATPAQVTAALIAQATPDIVKDPGAGSPNRLLYMGFFNDGACAGLCSNPTNLTINGSYQSGSLGTGAKCYQTTSTIHSGNCGNFGSPRTLKVNGTTMTCNNQNWASTPLSRNGGSCIQVTAGTQPWSFFTLW